MKLALKVLLLLAAAVALTAIGAFAALYLNAEAPARPVGFTQLAIRDIHDKPLEVGIWYPADAAPGFALVGLSAQRVATDAAVAGQGLPLIVISHGNNGMLSSHSDTALALAAAGFVVAAPTHTGDNARDGSYVGTPRWLLDRPRHIRIVLDYMLGEWPARGQLDPSRVGMFGFSAGAFTALVTAGGVPDLARIAAHCRAAPEFACTLWKPLPADPVPATEWVHDGRIKAVALAAPGYGFAFEPAGLAGVTAPVQLWTAAEDRNVPDETNAAVVRRLLPRPPEHRAAAGAGHFAFLAPCPAWIFPLICEDAEGFDRKAFHRELNGALVAFFRRELAAPPAR